MSEPVILAIPSKGRLKEQVEAWLGDCGLPLSVSGGVRGYLASLKGLPGVQVRLLSASDIADALGSGEAHLGVTGEDLLRERGDLESRVLLLRALGFGRADLVVAVPKSWLDVDSMADLEEVAHDVLARTGRRMRVATKYLAQTRVFFARHGVVDYRITESGGATEGAPASGAAELIVDITTTGATLEANALKTLDDGTILRSQATLIASLTAPWGPNARQAARDILARIAASEEALKTREVRARLPSPAHVVVETAGERFGAVSATGEDVDPHGFVALHCARDKVAELAGWLLTKGAERVSVAALEQTFAARNALNEALERRIGAGEH
jgi:ATP phosphoribosyltransferase